MLEINVKAFVYEEYGSPDVLQLKQLAKPVPGENELLIRVQALSLNAADWRTLRARPFLIRLSKGLFRPEQTIIGSDIAGQVEAVGTNVRQFRPGDEVFGDIAKGGFAEYVCTSPDKLCLKPSKLSFEEAAAIPKAANTALQALRDYGQIQSGQKVLVNGASGGVGTFAIQIAKAFGASVTGICGTRNLELVRSIGADDVIDYTNDDFTNKKQTYDLILDLVGNRSVSDYRRVLNPTGKVILIGFASMGRMFKSVLVGTWVARRKKQKITPMDAHINQENLVTLKAMIEAEKLKPVIDKAYPFNELPEAMRYLEGGHARGKVIITVE
jgi:NADPH:quinone reductase-like Zn-dependent oxidoreductase